jgi:hypothetical protein
MLTVSLMIPSAELGGFVSGLTKHYYPGASHVTLWFEPSGTGTRIRTRTLVVESGSLSPVPLASNGQLERALLHAIEAKVGGSADVPVAVGSGYRGKLEFWNVLFGIDAPPKSVEEPFRLIRELPVSLDRAWEAALQVISQSQVVIRVERKAGDIDFLAAHSTQTGTRYAVHAVAVELASVGSGTRMSLSIPNAQETAEESTGELKLIADRIGTELFLKDRVTWLTDRKGTK